MSSTDRWSVKTFRTWTCDGCGVQTTAIEQHPITGKARDHYITDGTDEAALDMPAGWVRDYGDKAGRGDYHSEACALVALSKRLVPA